jgi:hypothetical protein
MSAAASGRLEIANSVLLGMDEVDRDRITDIDSYDDSHGLRNLVACQVNKALAGASLQVMVLSGL